MTPADNVWHRGGAGRTQRVYRVGPSRLALAYFAAALAACCVAMWSSRERTVSCSRASGFCSVERSVWGSSVHVSLERHSRADVSGGTPPGGDVILPAPEQWRVYFSPSGGEILEIGSAYDADRIRDLQSQINGFLANKSRTSFRANIPRTINERAVAMASYAIGIAAMLAAGAYVWRSARRLELRFDAQTRELAVAEGRWPGRRRARRLAAPCAALVRDLATQDEPRRRTETIVIADSQGEVVKLNLATEDASELLGWIENMNSTYRA